MASRKRPTGSNQDDLFNPEIELLLPARLAIDGKVLGSPVRQLAVPARHVRCRLRPFAIRRVNGHETTLESGEILKVISAKTATPLEADLILLVPGATEPERIAAALELGEGRWMNVPPTSIDTLDRSARSERLKAVSASWIDAIHLREGRAAADGQPAQPGLRRPQVGALHAALAHATRSTDPATIVMPTRAPGHCASPCEVTTTRPSSRSSSATATPVTPNAPAPRRRSRSAARSRRSRKSFGEDSPQIDFGDGSLLIYSHLYTLPEGETIEPYPSDKIEAWDWSKANIRVEAQGTDKRADSVQRLVIDTLLADPDPYDVIFDDDGKGEIADVVALRITDSVVSVTLYHCKYSGADTPGARLGDLYEVCGQAQKSARWRDRPNRMLQHMLRREKMRRDRGLSSRIEQGSAAAIKKLKVGWQDYRFEFDVRIVQPGLSRQAISEEGLHLLAGVETYLLETRAMRLKIIGSE